MIRKDYEEYVFKMKKLLVKSAAEKGIKVGLDRLGIAVGEDAVIAILELATQEEDVAHYPSNWKQAFKERWFPAWAKKKWPVLYTRVWAIHKYPEVDPPLGAEFVHFKKVEFVTEPPQA